MSARDAMKAEIARRRVRQLIEAGYSDRRIVATLRDEGTAASEKFVRLLIGQERAA